MAETARIYVGTSGWSYPRGEGTWKGYFYPSSGKINELEFYGQFFDTVEVNNSFYRPPDPGMAAGWARRTPPGFRFAVKLWQKFTHPAMYRAATGEEAAISPEDVDIFKSSLEPLAGAGKLAALLAQFPPSFKNDPLGRRILVAVLRTFEDYPLAVELRHRSWSDDPTTAALLCEHNAAWVQIDEPKFSSSVAAELPLTADLAYFRFHGRNAAEWWTGNGETRYRYHYSPQEIEELAERVRATAEKTRLLFAFFNNHWQAYAPRNATDLKKSLQLSFRDLPVHFETADEGDTAARKGTP